MVKEIEGRNQGTNFTATKAEYELKNMAESIGR